MSWVFCISASLIAAIAAYLIYEKKYEDGFWGRGSLASIVVLGSTQLMVAISYEPAEVGLFPALFMLAVLVFITRHLCKYLQWRNGGKHDWNGQEVNHELQ